MKININDKFILTKRTRFLEEGTVVTVTKVENGIVHFVFGEDNDGGSGYMDTNTFEECFKAVEYEKTDAPVVAPSVCTDHVATMLKNSDIKVITVFDKCTIVSCRLPNGFVITESSACVSPENYNRDLGIEICYNKIADKVCELEAYKLQDALYTNNKLNEDDDEEFDECDCTCDGCCCECNNYNYDEGINNHIYH